jgi:hypothetical protein
LTKEQYASKLSHLCLVAADQLRELHVDNGVAAWQADGPRILAIERRFNRKLAALKPPESIQAAVAAYTSANDRGFALPRTRSAPPRQAMRRDSRLL